MTNIQQSTIEIDRERIAEIIRYVVQHEPNKTSAVAKLYKLLPYQRNFVRRLVGTAHATEQWLSIINERVDPFPTKMHAWLEGYTGGMASEKSRLASALTTFLTTLDSRT